MNGIPCLECITRAICKVQYKEDLNKEYAHGLIDPQVVALSNLIKKCSIIKDYTEDKLDQHIIYKRVSKLYKFFNKGL